MVSSFCIPGCIRLTDVMILNVMEEWFEEHPSRRREPLAHLCEGVDKTVDSERAAEEVLSIYRSAYLGFYQQM
jgi:hypothetical protein